MLLIRHFRFLCLISLLGSCTTLVKVVQNDPELFWQDRISKEVNQLGDRNWIIISEASFPAYSNKHFSQITVNQEISTITDYVVKTIEASQNNKPQFYLTRELSSLDRNIASEADSIKRTIKQSIHHYEITELDQSSIITLVENANSKYKVFLIRSRTTLPYSSVFIELSPSYWDAESEQNLRQKIKLQQQPITPQL